MFALLVNKIDHIRISNIYKTILKNSVRDKCYLNLEKQRIVVITTFKISLIRFLLVNYIMLLLVQMFFKQKRNQIHSIVVEKKIKL
jgi:hypothetical protein